MTSSNDRLAQCQNDNDMADTDAASSSDQEAMPASWSDISEETVRQWLLDHPDFFVKHADLLDRLKLPAEAGRNGPTLSLLQFQLQRLRQQRDALERDIARFLRIGHDNTHLFHRMHELHLGLISADTPADMLTHLRHAMEEQFKVDTLFIQSWEVPKTPVPGLMQLGLQPDWQTLFKQALHPRRPVCGPVTQQWQKLLVRHLEKNQVRSLCALPLGFRRVWGVLVLGSLDRYRFTQERDTLFLQQLGDVVSARLGPLFDDPWPVSASHDTGNNEDR